MMNAPVLDLGNSNLLRQHPGYAAHLLGHIDTLLDCPQLGDHLGHVLAHPDRLQVALFLGLADHHSLYFVVTLCHLLLKCHIYVYFGECSHLLMSTSPGSTKRFIDFCTLCPGAVLLHIGSRQAAFLDWNLITLLLLLKTW